MTDVIDKPKELKPLSKKHRRFLDEYLICFNATQAYLAVYPGSSYEASRVSASNLLAKPNIKAWLQTKLDEVHMGADEALKLTADIARGDVAQLMDVTSMGFMLDMKKAESLGLTKLIKKVKQKTTTKISKNNVDPDTEVHELEVELYSAQEAQRDILKVHGKLAGKSDVTSVIEINQSTPKPVLRRIAAGMSPMLAFTEYASGINTDKYGK